MQRTGGQKLLARDARSAMEFLFRATGRIVRFGGVLGTRSGRGMRGQITRLVSLFGSVLVVSSCARFETCDVVARILAVRGDATIVTRGDMTNRPLTINQRLAPGDRIRASAGSEVIVSLVPGIRIVLLGDSDLAIRKLDIRKVGNAVVYEMREREAHVHLATGSLYASLGQPPDQSRSVLALQTAAGEFRAGNGSIFFVRSDGSTTHLVCAEGAVIGRRDDGSEKTSLNAGQWQQWRLDGPVDSPAEVRAGSADLREIAAAFDADLWAASLERSHQRRLPSQGSN